MKRLRIRAEERKNQQSRLALNLSIVGRTAINPADYIIFFGIGHAAVFRHTA